MKPVYLRPKEIQDRYGYHPRTLVRWADAGRIECIKTPGGHRRYPLSAFETVEEMEREENRVRELQRARFDRLWGGAGVPNPFGGEASGGGCGDATA